MITTTYRSPLGDIALAADSQGLLGLWFADCGRPDTVPVDASADVDLANPFDPTGLAAQDSAEVEHAEDIDGADAESGEAGMACADQRNMAALGVLQRTWSWLNSYFAGQTPLWIPPLHLDGTQFEHEVWVELLSIPYGSSMTCAELAERIENRWVGSEALPCEVGEAVMNSPVQLIVPCHRVAGAAIPGVTKATAATSATAAEGAIRMAGTATLPERQAALLKFELASSFRHR